MSDIVERLQNGTTDGTALRWQVTDIHIEAAAEITRLRGLVEEAGKVAAKIAQSAGVNGEMEGTGDNV